MEPEIFGKAKNIALSRKPEIKKEQEFLSWPVFNWLFSQKPSSTHKVNKPAKAQRKTVDRKSSIYVKWVQKSLNRLMSTGLMVDGDFGKLTKRAVKKFQRRTKLKPDGIVGSRTEKALINAGASLPPKNSTLKTGISSSSPNKVSINPAKVKENLTLLGYDLKNQSLSNAIRTFQIDMRLKKAGKLDSKTKQRLQLVMRQFQSADKKNQPMRRLSRFRLTNYYVADEKDFAINPVIPVLDNKGRTLAKVSPSFFISMSVEGTGKLRDGRLLNVIGGKRGRVNVAHIGSYNLVLKAARKRGFSIRPTNIRYTGVRLKNDRVDSVLGFHVIPKSRLGKGYGSQKGRPHDPFFTLAADIGAYSSSDQRFCKKGGLVPRGTEVFILEYVGKKLPDGRIHNGWFKVVDTGGAIFGAHFDVFTGSKKWSKKVWKPHIGHVWFKNSEGRCPPSYDYGLTKKKKISRGCIRK